MSSVCSLQQGVCRYCGRRDTAHYSPYYCRTCLKFYGDVSRSLRDLSKVDPQIVSDFKNHISRAEKQELYSKHHNLTHRDLIMQIVQTVSGSRKRRRIDKLRAEGKAVYEDDIRYKSADIDEPVKYIYIRQWKTI